MATLDSFYSVVITQTIGAAPASGFIDNNLVATYGLAATPTVPATFSASEDKRRANWRYTFITQFLGIMCNAYTMDFASPGADANTPPTTFGFNLQVERGDAVLYTADELNPGQFLTGAAAIKRCVARALCQTETHETDVFDPTASVGYGNLISPSVSVPRAASRIENLTIGALFAGVASAAATITVTKIA